MLGSGSKKRRAGVQGTLLYMPAILIIFGIVVYPMLYALVMSFTGYSVRKPVMNFIGVANYRNLLGGLYRENPVKSRNYEAVKSSKKWENVGNSYIIPALLLYRYSYI